MRFWTVEEARDYLPRAKELLQTIDDALKQLEDDGVILRQLANGRGAEPLGEATNEQSRLSRRPQAVEDDFGERRATFRRTSLVDFPAVGDDGDVYFLCWKTDEDTLDWWHAPEAGFAGRRPLPR